jgi:hypothetical protein
MNLPFAIFLPYIFYCHTVVRQFYMCDQGPISSGIWIPPSASAMLAAVPLDLQPAVDRDPDRPVRPLEQAEAKAAFEARLAELERVIEATLDRAPGPVRFLPSRRAIWRALLLPAPYVLWLYRQQLQAGLDPRTLAAIGRGAFEADDRACHQRAIDALAIALVARAALGDARAVAELFDRIEGRPGPRRPDRSSDPPPMDLEPIVRLLNERR